MRKDSIVIVADDPSKVTDELLPKDVNEVNVVADNRMTSNKKVFIYAAGIFVCYFYFGILQEKITRSTYGESDKFTYTSTLVFVQCVVNALFAKIMLHTFMRQGEDPTRQLYYAICGLSYLGAMVSSNMALQHVNYPTQVVGKSCKPIPVMILGVLIGKKRYPFAKYCYVFMIVVGVCLFMYKDKPAVSEVDDDSPLLGMGEILLLISLTLDGITGAIQDRMRAEYQSKSGHMMYNINLWSTLVLGIVVFVTGEIWGFLMFVEKYPYVMYNMLGFSIMSALGQVFIYLVVSEFGPLLCSIITTTRKFFTVLGSVFLFGNTLIPRQWLGTALVFTGLTLDGVYGKQNPSKKK
ncbi:solute carrier family 35 member B1-like [Argiope bruennichi]|uniref:Solute carrier family 35 member B1 like protein n=1 Tax=Argiope bruennichi TaxID=94029 RepID=A0A8T0FAQ3_ARGBR|nr:solute carrier family 35 member B1-like [Argiope bruennichi]KAF8788256.1 Solute carrier family 35 member B1 like protein [Argiope bruennichi]